MINQFEAEETLNAKLTEIIKSDTMVAIAGQEIPIFWTGINALPYNNVNLTVKHYDIRERLAYISSGITKQERILYMEIRSPTQTLNSYQTALKISRYLAELFMYNSSITGLTTYEATSEDQGIEDNFYLLRLSIYYSFNCQIGAFHG